MEQKIFTLHTPRLMLRPLIPADAEVFFAYRSLPEVARYQGWEPMNLEEANEFIVKNTSTPAFTPDTWMQLAVCLPGGELIGDVGVHFYYDGHQVEFGYTLSPAFQGFGYAREAIKSLLDYFLLSRGMHRAFASVDPENVRSIRLLESLGFRKEAHHISSYLAKDGWHDDASYALLAEEWRARSASTR
jgi:RimJ/RimL family protein N-acetyltransferase